MIWNARSSTQRYKGIGLDGPCKTTFKQGSRLADSNRNQKDSALDRGLRRRIRKEYIAQPGKDVNRDNKNVQIGSVTGRNEAKEKRKNKFEKEKETK